MNINNKYENKYKSFSNKLKNKIIELNKEYSNIIILCIGTNKVLGDSIGPVVGSFIKKYENEYIKIYGTIEKNIDFLNTKNIIEEIYDKYINPYIITIDAALSKKNNVGEIIVSKGYIKIGKALEKNICFYSNINIKCVVGKYENINKNNFKILNDIDEYKINNMRDIVVYGIKELIENININV